MTLGDGVALGLLAVELVAVALIFAYTQRVGISPMPTLGRARRAMLDHVPADAGTIYELGCGWGTLAVPLARLRPGARVIAYELSPVPWLVARLRASGVRNLEVRRGDFFKATLGDADAVVCYLFPRGMERLRPKFEAELRPGAVVISNTFQVPGWTPERTIEIGGIWPEPVYVYVRRPSIAPIST